MVTCHFHPDYVLWIDALEIQYITFIDPKGLLRLQWTDPKIEFCNTIKELEERLQPSCSDKKIVLNSFILSTTVSETLQFWWEKNKSDLHSKNVICLNERDCIEVMVRKIMNINIIDESY